MGVQLPAGTWQSVPPQPQLASAAAAAAPQITQSVGGALPQATGVVAYPMQQFQVSPQVSVSTSGACDAHALSDASLVSAPLSLTAGGG